MEIIQLKNITKKYKDEVRMFCFNEGGEVVVENTFGNLTVNGHAYSADNLKTENHITKYYGWIRASNFWRSDY